MSLLGRGEQASGMAAARECKQREAESLGVGGRRGEQRALSVGRFLGGPRSHIADALQDIHLLVATVAIPFNRHCDKWYSYGFHSLQNQLMIFFLTFPKKYNGRCERKKLMV